MELTIGESGSWNDELLSAGSANFHTAAPGVALDGAGELHLVHPDPADERCLVHRQRASDADPWTQMMAVDDNDSLARVTVDADGIAHVLYWSIDGEVRYASPAL